MSIVVSGRNWNRGSTAAVALCLTAFITTTITTHAQDAVSFERLKSMSLEELFDLKVITVSRTESTVGQSPAAVSILTQEDIERSGATTIPELFRMVPGLHVARIDGNKWAIASRGFNNRFSRNLLVQIDGRSVYNPQAPGVVWDTVDYPLEDIERIEVIRGPGASVWGANAVNGVINIVTKSAKDTQGGLVSAGGGTEERGFGTFRYGAKLANDLFFRLYGKGFDRDKQLSPVGDPNDQWWGASTGVRLDWTPSEHDTLTFDGGYARSVTGVKDRIAMSSTNSAGLFAPDLPQVETTDNGHLMATWSRRLDADSSWRVQAYWDRWQRAAPLHLRDTHFDTYDLDFQHNRPLGTRQKLVWGLGYRYVDADLPDSQSDGGFSRQWLDNTPYMQVFSGFVQDEIALVEDRLGLTLGTKLEHNSFTQFEVQPSTRLLWTPTKRQSVWGAVSRALRTPGFTENDALLATPRPFPALRPAARLVANRGMKPEEVWAYELGYRIQAAATLSVDTALFYNVHDDLRVVRANTNLNSTVQGIPLAAVQFDNGMDGETYGVELAAHWRVTDWWRLYGAYTYLQIQLHRDRDLAASAEAAEGQDPHNQVYLRSSFNLPWNIEMDLIGRYVDQLSGSNPNGIRGVSDTLNAYVAFDARVAWRPHKNLLLEIVGQNLLDEQHPELGVNLLIRSPMVEIERAVYGRITWHF